MTEPSYSYSFSLSEDELLDVHVEMLLHTEIGRKRAAASRKSARGTALVALLITGLTGFGIIREWTGFMNVSSMYIFMVAVAAGFWALARTLWISTKPARVRKGAERLIKSVGTFTLRQSQVVTLSPAGFGFEGDGIINQLEWKHFEEAAGGEKFLMLIKHDQTSHIVPWRVVGNAAVQQELVRLCRDWIVTGGGGAEYAVVALLFDRDVPCPKCEYNLRNQTRPICPECGHKLDQHEIYARLLQKPKQP